MLHASFSTLHAPRSVLQAPRSTPRARLRRGLTLIEILLVLALLVIISAISVPLLAGSFSRAALFGAGDLLRGAWAKSRLAAMQSGQTHVFRFELNGGRFQIVALSALNAPANSEPEATIEGENPEVEPDPPELVRLSQNRLPEGIIFSGGNVASSAQLMATLPAAGGSAWSQPILFYPDGTTSDASLLLANEKQVAIRVTLRGLTGISQTVEVDDVEPETEFSP
jgi:prepilin-type N-terminal cleavage/methylation domain-containing protein